MGRNKDLAKILLLVLVGMFIPFLGSLSFVYGFHLSQIGTTFGVFLLIFGCELVFVYLYFSVGNWYAHKQMTKMSSKK